MFPSTFFGIYVNLCCKVLSYKAYIAVILSLMYQEWSRMFLKTTVTVMCGGKYASGGCARLKGTVQLYSNKSKAFAFPLEILNHSKEIMATVTPKACRWLSQPHHLPGHGSYFIGIVTALMANCRSYSLPDLPSLSISWHTIQYFANSAQWIYRSVTLRLVDAPTTSLRVVLNVAVIALSMS